MLRNLYVNNKDLFAIEAMKYPEETIQIALEVDDPTLLSLVDHEPLDVLEQAIKGQTKETLRFFLNQGYVDKMWDLYSDMDEPWPMNAIGELLLEDDEMFDILECKHRKLFEQRYFVNHPDKLPNYLEKIREREEKIDHMSVELAADMFLLCPYPWVLGNLVQLTKKHPQLISQIQEIWDSPNFYKQLFGILCEIGSSSWMIAEVLDNGRKDPNLSRYNYYLLEAISLIGD